MKKSSTLLWSSSLLMAILLIFAMPDAVFAGMGLLGYVGPGAGLGMIGALVAVVAVILLGLLAPVLILFKMLRRCFRSKKTTENETA